MAYGGKYTYEARSGFHLAGRKFYGELETMFVGKK